MDTDNQDSQPERGIYSASPFDALLVANRTGGDSTLHRAVARAPVYPCESVFIRG